MAKTRISNELMVEILLKTIDDLEKKLKRQQQVMEEYTNTIQRFLDLQSVAPEQIAENRRTYEKQAIENIDKTVEFFKSMHPLNYISTDVEMLLVSQSIDKLNLFVSYELLLIGDGNHLSLIVVAVD